MFFIPFMKLLKVTDFPFVLISGSPYDEGICLQENTTGTSASQNVKSDEEMSRVYQNLTLPITRDDINGSSNR